MKYICIVLGSIMMIGQGYGEEVRDTRPDGSKEQSLHHGVADAARPYQEPEAPIVATGAANHMEDKLSEN